MSRRLLPVLFCFFFSAWSLLAQARFTTEVQANEHTFVQAVDLGVGPFYAFYVVAEETWGALSVEHSPDGIRWAPAQDVRLDPHVTDRLVSGWVMVPAGEGTYRIHREGGGVLQLHWYNPGYTTEEARLSVAIADQSPSACPCALPEVSPRSAWCPGSCPAGSPASTDVTHLIVHHSAGTNNTNDWAAIVRVIYDLHVTGNGWDDIGYNYLIDPNGVIYEGRGNDIRGAHFCGSNSGTMGVCMLGTFTEVTPTPAALESLAKLLAWKSCDRDLNPLGSAYHASSELTLPHIAGHRQGCATACPGDAFYPLLPSVRQATAAEIAACQAVATTDAALVSEWRVYPNPTGDWLHLATPDLASLGEAHPLVLFDTWGRRVRTWTKFSANEPLYLGDLPAGVYQLRSLATGEMATVVKR